MSSGLPSCVHAAPITRISVGQLGVAPPSPLVARRVPRTAYIVLDPAKVPSSLTVWVDGVDRGGSLIDVQTFVTRDIANALAPYFEHVQVLLPGQPAPDGPNGVVVDVSLQRVDVAISGAFLRERHEEGLHRAVRDELHSGSAVLTWALALRLSRAPDYLFSFAGQSTSVLSADSNAAFRSMFERAIADLLGRYENQRIQETLLAIPPG